MQTFDYADLTWLLIQTSWTRILSAKTRPAVGHASCHASKCSHRPQYHVLLRCWGASVAVSINVILFILPTLYDLWALARKTSLSPFETARAFYAPVLQDSPTHLDSKAMSKEVGAKRAHSDLAEPPSEKKE